MGLDAGFDNVPALLSAIAVLVGVWLAVEHMLPAIFDAADALRGRDRCGHCGGELPSRGGLGYETRCRACEHTQSWG